MIYRLTVAYRGAGFAGWQRQPAETTVQGALEDALARVTGEHLAVVGAGRTDAGVHARGQVAHLESPRELELSALVHGANHHLPDGVRVLSAHRAPAGFHARKCARAKEYRYRVSRQRILSPLEAETTVPVRQVDVATMRAATRALVGRHDFSAFALAGGAHGQPYRRVLSALWHEDGPLLELRIVGDGFLRGMVRSLAGTLLEVGSGRRDPAGFAALLAGGERGEAVPTAPARGLTL